MLYNEFLKKKLLNSTTLCETDGYPCQFISTGKPLKDYKIYGNSIQNCTPSPTQNCEIESCGTKSRNLCEISESNCIAYNSNYSNFTISNNQLNANGNTLLGFKCKIDPGIAYTFSAYTNKATNVIFRIREYSKEPTNWNDSFIIQSVDTANQYKGTHNFTFTSSNTSQWCLCIFYVEDSNLELFDSLTISKIQLEKGTYSTEYIPYNKYKIGLMVEYVNLFNINSDYDIIRNNYSPIKSVNNNSITYTANGGTYRYGMYVFENYGQLTISASSILVNGGKIQIKTTNKKPTSYSGWDTCIETIDSSKTDYIKTINTTDKYIGILIIVVYQNEIAIDNLMVSRADNTNYIPYTKPDEYSIYSNEPLRKIGNYADYIDSKNKQIIRNIFHIHKTNEELRSANQIRLTINGGGINKSIDGETGLSNTIPLEYKFEQDNTIHWYVGTDGYGYIISPNNAVSISDYYIANNIYCDFEAYYPLATPIYETIDIPKIKTKKGNNTILANTETSPSNIHIKYQK